MTSHTPPTHLRRWLIGTLIASAIVGVFAGLLGGALVRRAGQYLPLVQGVRLDETNRGSEIVISEPRKVIVEQNVQIANVTERLRGITVQFVSPRRPAGIDSILPTDIIGQGTIVTSDGWAVTPRATKLDPDDAIAIVGDKTYAIERSITDTTSGLLFVKLQGSNLAVPPFADRVTLAPGHLLYGVTAYTKAVGAHTLADAYALAAGTDRLSFVRSSEGLDTFLALQDRAADAYVGSPLVTLEGEVAGILIDSQRAVPAGYVDAMIKTIIRNGTVKRPSLGVHYLNLAQTPGAALRPNLPARGAYLTPGKSAPAIAASSPLVTELKKDDIILSVEGQEINAQRDLQDIIREYRPGSEISLTVIASGQTKTISVKLGERP